ncbi:hypothetical protein BBH99_16055 [Chryseobacterium contaminans]|uniref:DUF6438 domain-containing protein n=1 Tax=Chryseobacterium contaminans TaxID=1423959 RepID=A0A1M7DU05_9FLAO|nr:DUF6438 domain-containing protein [Chryseobacterium contaminans]OCA80275.1 hypothetical protein BBH99_16055 [Chryseobacterium contaminans]SHL82858.1 hypothetical protein SAMN05444407_106272 [Chryseobacterium contaminans]
MKSITRIVMFFYFILTFSIKVGGQDKKLQGTWISKNNDVIIIKEKDNRFNTLSTIYENEQLRLKIIGDTLSFYKEYTKAGSEKEYMSKYDFYIKSKKNKTLTLIPESNLSKEFFGNRKKIVFIKQEYNWDKSISFEKLVYHTTNCYGTCPVIDLEIDKNGNIYLSGEFLNDKNKSGQFKGKLSDELLNELMYILKTSNLRTWSFPKKEGHDGAVTTLIVYYNGERKYFKSMFPPTIADQLINFLYGLNEKVSLIRTEEKKILYE